MLKIEMKKGFYFTFAQSEKFTTLTSCGKPNVFFFLNKLDEPYKTKAFENINSGINVFHVQNDSIEENIERLINESCSSISEAVTNTLYWETTKEGGDYWKDVYDFYL
jgi:hypothetical protein